MDIKRKYPSFCKFNIYVERNLIPDCAVGEEPTISGQWVMAVQREASRLVHGSEEKREGDCGDRDLARGDRG